MTELDGGAVAVLHDFYARQAHLIDTGQHEMWADTFTPAGEFHSPTYGEPAVGRERLKAISEAFSQRAAQDGERHRHLVQDLWVRRVDEASAEVQAYLLVVATCARSPDARLLRIVTLADQLDRTGGGWRIRCRKVTY